MWRLKLRNCRERERKKKTTLPTLQGILSLEMEITVPPSRGSEMTMKGKGISWNDKRAPLRNDEPGLVV